jgi:hypothetical protein
VMQGRKVPLKRSFQCPIKRYTESVILPTKTYPIMEEE